jgi:hypothetical protein
MQYLPLSGLSRLEQWRSAATGKKRSALALARLPGFVVDSISVEPLDGGFKIVDANGQSLAYVYGHADPRDAQTAKGADA